MSEATKTFKMLLDLFNKILEQDLSSKLLMWSIDYSKNKKSVSAKSMMSNTN